MINESTSGTPPASPCHVCSNGPVQIYHYGAPCPYLYAAGRVEVPGAIGLDTGEIHRATLLAEISNKDALIERLQAAAEHWCKRGVEYEKLLAAVQYCAYPREETDAAKTLAVCKGIARDALPDSTLEASAPFLHPTEKT